MKPRCRKPPKCETHPAKKSWQISQGQPESAFVYGLTLDLNGRSKEAVALYEQIYKLNPANQDLVQRMVSLYQDMGNMEEALSLVDEMISKTKESHPSLIMQRAIILSELNRNDEASKDLDALYKKHPDSDRIQFMSAVALEKIGKLDEALVRYEGIAEESSVKLPSEYRKVLILKQQNKNQESVDLAKSLTKRTDADSVTWQILIELFADLKRYDEAREIAATALNLFPEKTHLMFLKGVYEERAGRMVEAEESMRKVVAQNGKHAAALNFLGYMLAEQNRNLDEAEKLIQRALAVKPGDGSYLDSLGWVYYQKKEYKKALEVLLKAKESSPKEGVIFEHIGDCHLQLRDPLSAVQNFEMALTLDLEERDKVRIQLKLDQARRQLK